MLKCGESKTIRIMMATVPHVTSGSGLRKFQADGFLLDRVYIAGDSCSVCVVNLIQYVRQHSPQSLYHIRGKGNKLMEEHNFLLIREAAKLQGTREGSQYLELCNECVFKELHLN